MTEGTRRRCVRLAQMAASAAVLWALARDLDRAAIADAWARSSGIWLVFALLSKALGLCVHELRLWLALPRPRPPLAPVFVLGFVAGMMNLVLPARGGDLLAIALLHRECGVRVPAATAAVGLVGFLEAAVFGLFLIGVLGLGAARWEQVIGAAAQDRALSFVALVTGGGLVALLVLSIGGRLLGRDGRKPGPLTLIRDTAAEVGAVLARPTDWALHLSLAAVSVAFTLGGFTLGLPAAGVDVPLPWLAGAGVLALSSVAAVALPPTFAAGPAAISVAVLAVFGVDRAGALAYAGVYWLVAHLPAVALGLPGLWGRTLVGRGGRTPSPPASPAPHDAPSARAASG